MSRHDRSKEADSKEQEDDEALSPPRVGRPRRYSTEQVIQAAIELADEHGIRALSMPQLAKRLEVGTMTLYGYVGSKQELLDMMAERILEGLDVPESDDWREALRGFFSDFRTIVLSHPALAGLVANGRITSPRAADVLEIILEEMTAGGAPIEEAVRTFYAALTYTIGFVIWEIPRAHDHEKEYAEYWAQSLSRLDPDKYPALTGPAAEVAPTVASTEQFTWGLNRIIDAQTLIATETDAATREM